MESVLQTDNIVVINPCKPCTLASILLIT